MTFIDNQMNGKGKCATLDAQHATHQSLQSQCSPYRSILEISNPASALLHSMHCLRAMQSINLSIFQSLRPSIVKFLKNI